MKDHLFREQADRLDNIAKRWELDDDPSKAREYRAAARVLRAAAKWSKSWDVPYPQTRDEAFLLTRANLRKARRVYEANRKGGKK